jgi:hypothetical protein
MVAGAVEELSHTPIPEQVWHYTTLQGFEGILSSGAIWATDLRFLNDTSEFVHAREIAKACLHEAEDVIRKLRFEEIEFSELIDKEFTAGALSPREQSVFVSSFTTEPDLLSQWMRYADNGRGVAVAFDLRMIRPPQDLELAVTFAPCVYTQAEKERLIRAAFAHFTDSLVLANEKASNREWITQCASDFRMIERIYGQPVNRPRFESYLQGLMGKDIRRGWQLTLFDLLRAASHCKDQGFREEQEWRLALPRSAKRIDYKNPVGFRGTRGTIPYIAFGLRDDRGRLPVTEVKLGPLCQNEEDVQIVMDTCRHVVPVSKSTIPLRDPTAIF